MVPVLSPTFSSSSASLSQPPSISRQMSASSMQSLTDLLVTASSSRLADNGAETYREEGLRHAKIRLDARQYKKPAFASQLLDILRKLHVHVWATAAIAPADVVVQKISGALTNAVFFVSCPSVPAARTVLLRVYGSSSGSLISRPRELHILHVLSSVYKIGPRVYGTYDNGRIEEFFDSVTLTAADIRDPQISRWIGARMAELHSVDIAAVGVPSPPPGAVHPGFDIADNVFSWLAAAKDVLALPAVDAATRRELDLPRFRSEWARYLAWALARPHTFGTRRIFAHNDAQYGNLLRLRDGSEGIDEHRQIIVVDFEYAGPNPAAYDIANHFHEWTADYHCATPHLLTPARYPTRTERENFYLSYIEHAAMLADDPIVDGAVLAEQVAQLDRDVAVWGAASHAGWAIWGIVQAREDLEAGTTEPEFDYIGYAKGRMAGFRKALASFNI